MSADRVAELRALAAKIEEITVAWLAEPTAPAPRLLTFDQTAEALAVSRGTVQNLVNAGEMPVVEVGERSPRIDVKDIEAYIKRRRERRGRG